MKVLTVVYFVEDYLHPKVWNDRVISRVLFPKNMVYTDIYAYIYKQQKSTLPLLKTYKRIHDSTVVSTQGVPWKEKRGTSLIPLLPSPVLKKSLYLFIYLFNQIIKHTIYKHTYIYRISNLTILTILTVLVILTIFTIYTKFTIQNIKVYIQTDIQSPISKAYYLSHRKLFETQITI